MSLLGEVVVEGGGENDGGLRGEEEGKLSVAVAVIARKPASSIT
jgi:hypothetical protein